MTHHNMQDKMKQKQIIIDARQDKTNTSHGRQMHVKNRT